MSYSLGDLSDDIKAAAARKHLEEEYKAAHGGAEKPGFFANMGDIMKWSLILASVVVIGIPVSKIMKG